MGEMPAIPSYTWRSELTDSDLLDPSSTSEMSRICWAVADVPGQMTKPAEV